MAESLTSSFKWSFLHFQSHFGTSQNHSLMQQQSFLMFRCCCQSFFHTSVNSNIVLTRLTPLIKKKPSECFKFVVYFFVWIIFGAFFCPYTWQRQWFSQRTEEAVACRALKLWRRESHETKVSISRHFCVIVGRKKSTTQPGRTKL